MSFWFIVMGRGDLRQTIIVAVMNIELEAKTVQVICGISAQRADIQLAVHCKHFQDSINSILRYCHYSLGCGIQLSSRSFNGE